MGPGRPGTGSDCSGMGSGCEGTGAGSGRAGPDRLQADGRSERGEARCRLTTRTTSDRHNATLSESWASGPGILSDTRMLPRRPPWYLPPDPTGPARTTAAPRRPARARRRHPPSRRPPPGRRRLSPRPSRATRDRVSPARPRARGVQRPPGQGGPASPGQGDPASPGPGGSSVPRARGSSAPGQGGPAPRARGASVPGARGMASSQPGGRARGRHRHPVPPRMRKPAGKGSSGSRRYCESPVTHARPRTVGTTAG